MSTIKGSLQIWLISPGPITHTINAMCLILNTSLTLYVHNYWHSGIGRTAQDSRLKQICCVNTFVPIDFWVVFGTSGNYIVPSIILTVFFLGSH